MPAVTRGDTTFYSRIHCDGRYRCGNYRRLRVEWEFDDDTPARRKYERHSYGDEHGERSGYELQSAT